MTVPMRVMSAGYGDKYLLRTVTIFGDEAIDVGDEAAELQLQRLIGQSRDPVSNQALGSPYRKYPTVTERIEHRTSRLDAGLPVTRTCRGGYRYRG